MPHRAQSGTERCSTTTSEESAWRRGLSAGLSGTGAGRTGVTPARAILDAGGSDERAGAAQAGYAEGLHLAWRQRQMVRQCSGATAPPSDTLDTPPPLTAPPGRRRRRSEHVRARPRASQPALPAPPGPLPAAPAAGQMAARATATAAAAVPRRVIIGARSTPSLPPPHGAAAVSAVSSVSAVSPRTRLISHTEHHNSGIR